MAVNGTSNGHAGEQVTGRVLSVNERGFRLEGREGWLNVSKWATDVTLPDRGQAVAVQLDGGGFVRAIGPAGGVTTTAVPGAGPTKDVTITRLAVLKAASAFAASKPEAKSADVLAIAAAWERWVLREEP